MSYQIIQKFISKNRSGKSLKPVGSVLHETATPGATDEAEYNYFNRGDRGASAHAFVDFDSITQTIPWNEQAWHAGPTANHTRIGIELCHYDDAVKFQAVWDRAVWLFAWLHINMIKQTKITKENLMSHAEVSNKWHETNHQDPISYFAKFGKTVNQFRAEVQEEINNQLKANQPKQVKSVAKAPSYPGYLIKYNPKKLDANVKLIQQKLKLKVDGFFGNATLLAVQKFQKAKGLQPDGIVGEITWNKLF